MVYIDKDISVFEMVNTYPETKKIMVELGFEDILKPGMLHSAGRIMTIYKGARMKNIDWDDVVEKFGDYGYQLGGQQKDE